MDKLNPCARQYGMEIRAEKSKDMMNAISLAEAYTKLNGEQLEQVQAFKYLGSTLTSDGCSPEDLRYWMETVTAAMRRLSSKQKRIVCNEI